MSPCFPSNYIRYTPVYSRCRRNRREPAEWRARGCQKREQKKNTLTIEFNGTLECNPTRILNGLDYPKVTAVLRRSSQRETFGVGKHAFPACVKIQRVTTSLPLADSGRNILSSPRLAYCCGFSLTKFQHQAGIVDSQM